MFAQSGKFQSAPPVETRGDGKATIWTATKGSFNPLPPSKRGETSNGPRFGAYAVVSIRSPRRNEGRHNKATGQASRLIVSIRSPRRNEGRLGVGRPSTRQFPVSIRSPVETRGDMVTVCSRFGSKPVSIRSPRRNEGRHAKIARCCRSAYVSIRSPVETRGDVA